MNKQIDEQHHCVKLPHCGGELISVTFLGDFLTLVSSRMSSKRNMYMSTAFDISATNIQKKQQK